MVPLNSQKRTDMGRGPDGSQAQELLVLWSWGTSPSQPIDVFANLEAPDVLYFRIFTGSLSHRPSALSRDWEGGGAEGSKLLIVAWSFW